MEIRRKSYKDFTICFTRHDIGKSRILSHYNYELMGKIEEDKKKKYLMIDDYILDKVLDKIKEIIGIGKSDDTKILIESDDKLSSYITLKNVMILITCVVKDGDKFYLQIFLQKALVSQNWWKMVKAI